MTHIDKRLDLARENIAAGIMKNILVESYSEYSDLSFQAPVSLRRCLYAQCWLEQQGKGITGSHPLAVYLALLRKNMLHSASHNIRSRLRCFYRMFTPQGLRFILFGFRSPLFFTLSLTLSVLTPCTICITNPKMGFHQHVHGHFNE